VCPSDFAAERLQSFGLTVPTWVVSNGTPPRRPRPASRGPLRRTESYLVLCVGRLAREKRQDVIIDAVARSQHRDRIRLVVAGAGPLEDTLRRRAREHGLAVEFGYVSDERLAQLQSEAHLFIHASEVELEGMAVLEAMAAGLPVLVADSSNSAAPRLACGPEFLFRAGDAGDLAAHLDRLLDAPAMLAEGARHSVDYAGQHTFHRSVRTLEQVYETVLANATTRRAPALATSEEEQGAA
jgi:1,2-diacylglycerol 3-alpha-glucosyltransferase